MTFLFWVKFWGYFLYLKLNFWWIVFFAYEAGNKKQIFLKKIIPRARIWYYIGAKGKQPKKHYEGKKGKNYEKIL